jgi:hypothetical protein
MFTYLHCITHVVVSGMSFLTAQNMSLKIETLKRSMMITIREETCAHLSK